MTFRRWTVCSLCLLGGVTVVAAAQKDELSTQCARGNLVQSAVVQGYTFRAYERTDSDTPGCVSVYRNGKLDYLLLAKSDEDMTYRLGQLADPVNKIPLIPDGTDLTGNGHPDMIVTSWSGGAHCCGAHYIFELEPRLRLIAKLDDGDTNIGHFEDLDQTNHFYYVTTEIWSYWPRDFASSVSHDVILKWDHGRFRLDLERMRRPAPTPEQWKDALSAVDDSVDDRGSLGISLWDTVLDLIDTGHSELAWKFVAEANPKALKGNNASLKDFCSMLSVSSYWPDIKPTLKDVPEQCARAINRP